MTFIIKKGNEEIAKSESKVVTFPNNVPYPIGTVVPAGTYTALNRNSWGDSGSAQVPEFEIINSKKPDPIVETKITVIPGSTTVNITDNTDRLTSTDDHLKLYDGDGNLIVTSEGKSNTIQLTGITASTTYNGYQLTWSNSYGETYKATVPEFTTKPGENILSNTRKFNGWTWIDGTSSKHGRAFSQPKDFLLDGLDETDILLAHLFNYDQDKTTDMFEWKPEINLEKGKEYTVSVIARAQKNEDKTLAIPITFMADYQSDPVASESGVLTETIVSNKWTRYSYTWIPEHDGAFTNFRMFASFTKDTASAYYSGGSVYMALPKLEEGNKATTWTPNPTDK